MVALAAFGLVGVSAAAGGSSSPTITSTLSQSSGFVGDTVNDTASLSGATSTAGGTVTYTVYSDSSCTQNAQDAGTVAVADGSVPSSNGIAFGTPGTFYWQAVYSGDTDNDGATSACNDAQLAIAPAPTTGTIEIVKNTVGDDGEFDFSGSSPDELTLPAGFEQFKLTTTRGTDRHDFTVLPGSYTVAEAPQAHWTLTGLSCTSGESNNGHVDGSNSNQADIQVTAGGFVTCTFTNTKLSTLIVKKLVDNSSGTGSKVPANFSLRVTGPGGFDQTAPGSSTGTTYTDLFPGTYQVTEPTVAGYNRSGITGCLADGSVVLRPGDTSTCTLTNSSNAPTAPAPPATPAPPTPKIDLAITKTASPNPATVGKAVTWTMVVTNNGPNGATGVTVADPLPAGMSFVSVATSQGSCTGGALVSCQLGSMAAGSSVTITLVTTATTAGTVTNTATAVGKEQETNSANNTASGSTVVNGAFTPPVKQVQYCTALVVSPKSILAGHPTLLTLHVSQHNQAKAGIKVRIKGSTLLIQTKPSNSKGIVTQRVNPKKAGIVTFVPVAKKGCSNPRVGVIGVFTPPVTG